jgi:hypothetical protein
MENGHLPFCRRLWDAEVCLDANLIYWRIIGKFSDVLICLNVNVLLANGRLRGVLVAIEELLSTLSPLVFNLLGVEGIFVCLEKLVWIGS